MISSIIGSYLPLEGSGGRPIPSLKQLARDKIKVPFEALPFIGAGVPYKAIPNQEESPTSMAVESLPGMGNCTKYTVFPTICQLFKDAKIEKPRIALLAYYLDQLGDIRILLNVRMLIKERFGVEPIILASKDNINRTYEFLHNSEEQIGLNCIDLDKVASADCQNLDVIIHGPGINGIELMTPKSIVERYPTLRAALNSENPPAVFSLLECESGNFSYSANIDEVKRARIQVRIFRRLLEDIKEHYEENPTEKLPKEHSERLPWALPIAKSYSGCIKDKDLEISQLMDQFSNIMQLLIDHPVPDSEKVKVIIANLDLLIGESLRLVKFIRFPPDRCVKVVGTQGDEIAKTIVPQVESGSLVYGVQNLYELQMGLNPISSLGWFKLPKVLGDWVSKGLLDTAEGRNTIFSSVVGNSAQEIALIKGLKVDPITGIKRDTYCFGYCHNILTAIEFINQAKTNNPAGQVVLNVDPGNAEQVQDCNIYNYSTGQFIDKKSAFTIHVYSKLQTDVFDGLMAASDPSLRLAGGDNTLFTTLMLGTDDLIYEFRAFKQGMIIALFQLAKEFSDEERNCIIDRMLEMASSKILFEMRSYQPAECAAYELRKKENRLNQAGSPAYKRAFRKIGAILRNRAENFNDNFVGFINLQIAGRRDKSLISNIDKMVGDGKIFTEQNGFAHIKSHIK